MFVVNEDNSIFCTRGDTGYLCVRVADVSETDEGDIIEAYQSFDGTEVIRFTVYGKKNCKDVIFQKVIKPIRGNREVEIVLTKDDTSKFDFTSKPKEYWYDVEFINNFGTRTIIGYDEDGPKIFRVYPEGAEMIKEDVPEEVPEVNVTMDISITSTEPVASNAVALEFLRLYKVLEQNGLDLTLPQSE